MLSEGSENEMLYLHEKDGQDLAVVNTSHCSHRKTKTPIPQGFVLTLAFSLSSSARRESNPEGIPSGRVTPA